MATMTVREALIQLSNARDLDAEVFLAFDSGIRVHILAEDSQGQEDDQAASLVKD
jgi:hypothetical protein